MKRALSILLCLLLVITAFPATALAVNDSSDKEQFIKYWRNLNQKQIQSNELFMDVDNGMTVSLNGCVENLIVSFPDQDLDLQDISAKAGVTLKADIQDDRLYCGLDAAYRDKELAGEFYLEGNRIIVTRESIESIDKFYPLSEDIKDTFGLTSLPQYIVIEDEEFSFDWSEISELQSSISTDMVVKAVEEFIRIIPQECFSHSEGYYVLEFDGSLVTMGKMLNNLKKNRESIAEACANCMPKLQGMSDEEFEAQKQDAKQELLDAIDSVSISDLAQLADSGITIETFRIKAAENIMILEVAIKGTSNDISLEKLTLNTTTRFQNGKITREGDAVLAIAELQGDNRFALNLHSNSVINGAKCNEDITLQANIKIDDDLIKGDILMDFELIDKKPVIDMPVLTDQNSIVLDEDEVSDEDRPDANEITVMLNGYPVYFEDAQPIIINNRVLVPLRTVAEELDCEVSWEPPKYVTVSNVEKKFVLTIDSNQILYESGGIGTLDVAPTIIDGRTYMPVRFVSEEMGMEVDWNDESRIVFINYPNVV